MEKIFKTGKTGVLRSVGMLVFLANAAFFGVSCFNDGNDDGGNPQLSRHVSNGEELHNGISVVRVNAGNFTMGVGATSIWWSPATQQVNLTNDFWIGKYEVTNAQFAAFLNSVGVGSDGVYNGNTLIYSSASFSNDWGVYYTGGQWVCATGFENHPVVFVTWFGADEFCRFVGGRLPTEAEWEWAARGGNKSNGYIYSGSDNLDEVAWWGHNFRGNSGYGTNAVGQKMANELGIYDMSGNVFEWVSDWWGEYSYSTTANPTGLGSGSDRVLRGGSWDVNAGSCPVAYRVSYLPSTFDSNLGFRVVFDLY